MGFEPVFWHWLALGVALAAVETVLPGAFFLWLGIAAFATGLIKLIFGGLSWEGQAIIFGVRPRQMNSRTVSYGGTPPM